MAFVAAILADLNVDSVLEATHSVDEYSNHLMQPQSPGATDARIDEFIVTRDLRHLRK